MSRLHLCHPEWPFPPRLYLLLIFSWNWGRKAENRDSEGHTIGQVFPEKALRSCSNYVQRQGPWPLCLFLSVGIWICWAWHDYIDAESCVFSFSCLYLSHKLGCALAIPQFPSAFKMHVLREDDKDGRVTVQEDYWWSFDNDKYRQVMAGKLVGEGGVFGVFLCVCRGQILFFE